MTVSHVPPLASRHGKLPMIYLFAVLGMLGTSIILLRTHTWGVGIGSDEAQYLSMAKNFAEGKGFTNYEGKHLSSWPPLFPATLAVGVFFGLDAPDAARFLNATAFGLIVFLSGLYLSRRVESRLLALGVAMALLMSPPLLSVFSDALTDGPFLLLVLLSLITLDGHLDSGRRSALIWAAVFALLSVLTRYVGALVMAVGVLMLLAGRTGRGSVKNVVIYVLVTTLPISAWMVRNVVVSGFTLGRRVPVDEPVAVIQESMQTLVDVIFHLHVWGGGGGGTAGWGGSVDSGAGGCLAGMCRHVSEAFCRGIFPRDETNCPLWNVLSGLYVRLGLGDSQDFTGLLFSSLLSALLLGLSVRDGDVA